MSHTYTANFVHCVFSTKERRNLIPEELHEQLWAYLLGIANNLNLKSLAIGGTSNHFHALIGIPSKNVGCGECPKTEGKLLAMDRRARDPIPMAGRVWCVQP